MTGDPHGGGVSDVQRDWTTFAYATIWHIAGQVDFWVAGRFNVYAEEICNKSIVS